MSIYEAIFRPIRSSAEGDVIILRAPGKSYAQGSAAARNKLRLILRDGEARRWTMSSVRQVIR